MLKVNYDRHSCSPNPPKMHATQRKTAFLSIHARDYSSGKKERKRRRWAGRDDRDNRINGSDAGDGDRKGGCEHGPGGV